MQRCLQNNKKVEIKIFINTCKSSKQTKNAQENSAARNQRGSRQQVSGAAAQCGGRRPSENLI